MPVAKTRPATGDARTRRYRFDARLNGHQTTLIQRAAELEGRSMTDFVLQSAQAAAEKTLRERAILVLTDGETEAFVDAVAHPAAPGKVLRAAAGHYKKNRKESASVR